MQVVKQIGGYPATMGSTPSSLSILLLLSVINTQNHILGVNSQVNNKQRSDIKQAQAWKRFFTNKFHDRTKVKYQKTPHVINWRDGFKYSGCDEVRQAGYQLSGYYRVWFNASIQYNVVCHHEGNASYTWIQQRMYGDTAFNRNWKDYVQGFGSPTRDYWAGLNHIYYLTTTGHNILHVLLQAWNYEKRTISYHNFQVLDSKHYYTMYVSHPYAGNVTDDLSYHSGMRFATYDFPDHLNCAKAYQAGWWYNQCAKTLLNGKYYHGGKYHPSTQYPDGIFWQDWAGLDYSMKYAAMVLSPSSEQPENFPFN